MGTCRLLNVLLGMSAAGAVWRTAHWLVAGGIGTYVTGVTWLARTEVQLSRRLSLLGATGVVILGIGMLASMPSWSDRVVPLLREQPQRWWLLMLVLGALITWRCLRAILKPEPDRVQAAVQLCILSLIVLDAAVCYAVRGMIPAVMILLLIVPATMLSRWIRVT